MRKSPSGPVNGLKGTMTLASTEISGQSGATQTGTFFGARRGDVVSLNPRANLTDSVSIAFSRVVSDDVIVVGFVNVGASLFMGAMTFDVATRHSVN